MDDKKKTKDQLLTELRRMRERIGELEPVAARGKQTKEAPLSEEEYGILVEKSPLGVSIIGRDGHYKYINPKFIEIFGYTLEDILPGREWFRKAYPDQEYRSQVVSTWINDLKESKRGESRPRIFIVTCKDGLEKTIHFRPVTMETGEQFVIYEDITDRTRAEETIRQSRERLNAFMNSAPDAFALFDSKLNLVEVNKVGLGMFPAGTKKEDIIGKSIREIGTENYHKYLEVIKTGKSLFIDNVVAHPKFGKMDFAVRAFKVGDGIGIIATDITERKRAEEKLRESEQSYRELANSITDIFFAMDRDLRYTYWNKASEELTGIKAKDAIGKSILEIFPDNEETRTAVKVYQGVLKTKQPKTFVNEYRIGGKRYFFEISGYSSKDGLSVFVKDITERKNAEQEIKEARDDYLSITNLTGDIIVKVDREGRWTFLNDGACEFWGKSREELIGSAFADYLHPDDQEKTRAAVEEGKTKKLVRGLVNRQKTPRGWRTVEWNGAAIFDEEDRYVGFQATGRDITERKKTEDALRMKDSAIESSINAIAFADLEENLTYVNNSFLKLWGYSDDKQVLGRPATGFWQMKEKALEVIEALRERGSWIGELVAKKKDGLLFDVQLSASMVTDKVGKPICMMSSFVDITQRKKAEEELKSSEERLRILFEFAPDGIYLNDLKGTFIDGNKAAEELTGYKREELIGKNFLKLKLLPPGQIPRAVALLAKNALGKPTGPDELILSRKDGKQITVEISTYPVKIEGKSLALGIARNVTEHKKAKEEIRRFKTISDRAGHGVAMSDLQGNLLYLNESFAQMHGCTVDELIGKNLSIFHNEEQMKNVNRLNEKLRKEGSFVGEEVWHKRKDGSAFPTLMTGTLIRDGKGKPSFLSATAIDITERKQVQEKLQRTLKKLRRALGATIQAMALAVEMKDAYTAGHQRRVTDLARAIGTEMQVSQHHIDGIRMAGTIHDIGKIGVPAEILNKPIRLTDIEFSLIKIHPLVGYNILNEIKFPWPVAKIVVQHHERMNGSGYPHGLSGEDILLEARILGVADVVEAMASHRPYRPALGIDKALEEMREKRGILYDPEVVDTCLKLFTEKGFKFKESKEME